MHGFHYMPRVGIQQVSLEACRRWDSMCHRLMTISWINELLAPLDLGHWESAKVALYARSTDKGSFFCQFPMYVSYHLIFFYLKV